MKIYIGMFVASALALILVAVWPLNATKAQTYWGYGVERDSGYMEIGQGWQGNAKSKQVEEVLKVAGIRH